MSYITEILAFNDLLLSQPLSTGQIALWYALMYINNKSGWVEWFSAPNRTLEFYTGLSRQGVNKARNSLKQSGLIDFKSSGTKATMYKLTRMSKSVQDSIQDSVQVEDDSDHTMSNSLQVGLQRSVQNSIQSGVQNSVQSSSTLIRQEENRRDKTKKVSKKRETTYDEILDRLVEDKNLKAAYLEFIKMRKLIKKPMTNKALEMLIRKVDKLEPDSIERKVELLDNAVLHNWQSVYPLKDNDLLHPLQTANRLKTHTKKLSPSGEYTAQYYDFRRYQMRNYFEKMLEAMPESAKQAFEEYNKLSDEGKLAFDVNRYNSEVRENTDGGIDCDICHNKRQIAKIGDNGQIVYTDCVCVRQRALYAQMRRSGAANPDKYTFDSYKAVTDWQKQIKQKAIAFLNDDVKSWFFIGGQVGAGKTHICTAILLDELKRGKRCRYMSWTSDMIRLNALINDRDYITEKEKFTKAEALYVDDLFKHRKGDQPTSGEFNRAMEILNERYNLFGKYPKTIISSEYTTAELLKIDEALASRIIERTSGGFAIDIARDIGKNHRLKS